MTWGWWAFKFSTTLVADFCTTANPLAPVTWTAGASSSQITILYNEKILSDHDSTFDEKILALRMIEWMVEYRNGLLCGAAAKGVSIVASSVTSEIGQEAGKEIAKHGGKFTPLARDLILKGKKIAVEEKILTAVIEKSGWVGRKENIVSILDFLGK